MVPILWGSAVRLKSPAHLSTARVRTRLAAGTRRTLGPRTEPQRRIQNSPTSRAFSQQRSFTSPTLHESQKPVPRANNHARSTPIDASTTPLYSGFPTKTLIGLCILGGLAYYFIDITEPTWTDGVLASFTPSSDETQISTPLHFFANKEEVEHWISHHIPDSSAGLKDPAAARFFSDHFEKLCSGWMMSVDEAKKGVEGMEGVQMPVTHGCRFRSNEPCEDYFALGTSPGVGGKLWNYWAVMDGHAGRHTALYLQWSLIPYLSSALLGLGAAASSVEVETRMRQAFVNIDKQILDRAKTAANWYPAANAAAIAALTPVLSGSCALVAAFDPETATLRVANTGDSRAVLGRWDASTSTYTCIPLSEDQTGFNKNEVDRLTAAHPNEPSLIDPTTGRLLGIAVTRAFGDHRWKWPTDLVTSVQRKFWASAPRPGTHTPPYMTAEPEVSETHIVREPHGAASKSDFLILASDGLWDRISSEHAVDCISSYLSARARGNGSVKQDPNLLANPPCFHHTSFPDLEPGVTCDEHHGVQWKATPEYFAIEDENAAVCLARNAMGGTRRGLMLGILAAPDPWGRNAVDDTTILVVFFDSLGEGGGGARQTVAGEGTAGKKRWWWPL
ncbi:protein serine/threonine phosphatase 2C [Decorospora gaudefroyi]|uniref:Protein serine/threonine phosphatase 2C n=1 Tax=Decorospora gaudefroyi TaxID=184978 RepID=A0A6A5KIJ8_9PLEO|nr:protein serine/threonine phosphatase 2C [Decorospora gaudefroyi]